MKLDRVIAVRNNKTVYRDGDECIKVFDSTYSQADVLSEALNQSRAASLGLNVPRIIGVSTVNGKCAMTMEYIKGKSLARLIEESPQESEKCIEYLVDLQLEVHSKDSGSFNSLKDKLRAKIGQAEIDSLTKNRLNTQLDSMPEHTKLCHGDFIPSNVIIRDDGAPYIIDWAHVAQGNASADAARTYFRLFLDGNAEIAEQYIQLFCEKSRTKEQYVRQWMPIVAASHSIKGNEKERKFLLSQINNVENE